MSIYLGTTPIANTGYDKANTDLSNLTSTGKNIANWSTNITNCITEIPQDIKLELNNGTLTLKAGSRIYVPNGSGVFNAVTTSADKSWGQTTYAGGKLMVFYRNQYNDLFSLNDYACYSGSTAPTARTNMVWYDTANNKIKWTSNGGSTWNDEGLSLPITNSSYANGTGFTAIDQVFNGFGYIGSTVFALPGVKGLIPNGRNADGSLKNLEFTVNQVHLNTNTNAAVKTKGIYFYSDGTIAGTSNGIYIVSIKSLSDRPSSWTGGYCIYVEDENRNYVNQNTEPSLVFMYASLSQTTTNITSFNPKTAFHAVDYNDLTQGNSFKTVVETYVNGTSWYRVWSDGWIEQGGYVTTNTSTEPTVNFLKPFSNTNYFTCSVPVHSNQLVTACIRAQATGSVTFKLSLGGWFKWCACGY